MASLIDKISSFADHHQILIALIIAFGVVSVTWGTEKILEEYVFSLKKPYGYIIAIILGLGLLWITKHIIQHVL